MTIRIADPLPECGLCETPTARKVYEANGGLCRSCDDGIAATVRMLPVGLPPVDDHTGFVEGYRPPVPTPKQRPAFPGHQPGHPGDYFTDEH